MNILVNGVNLFYEKSGSGPPLLLLHGNGEDHRIFDALAEKLCNDFTMYAIDSRNHGQSGKTVGYSYETMAEDVRQFIAALHLTKPHIIGFSDGAIVALLLAIGHGETIGKMALLGVNLKPDDFTAEYYQFLLASYRDKPDPLLLKLMLEQPNISLEATRRVNNPTLIVAAEHDLFKPEMFAGLAAAMPDAALTIMAGHNHDSYIVGKDILYEDLRRFLFPPLFSCGNARFLP